MIEGNPPDVDIALKPVVPLPVSVFDKTRIIAGDGTTLPLSIGALKVGLGNNWRAITRMDKADFTNEYYLALGVVGCGKSDVNADLKVLLRYCKKKGELGNATKTEIRGAYGYDNGIFDSTGKWKPEVIKGREAEIARLESRPSKGSPINLDNWDDVYKDAIKKQTGLLDVANIDLEFAWISANDMEWPDFSCAPSRNAIKNWLAINMPGNGSLRNDFIKLQWSKRLSPGKKTPTPVLGADEEIAPGVDQGLMSKLGYDD